MADRTLDVIEIPKCTPLLRRQRFACHWRGTGSDRMPVTNYVGGWSPWDCNEGILRRLLRRGGGPRRGAGNAWWPALGRAGPSGRPP